MRTVVRLHFSFYSDDVITRGKARPSINELILEFILSLFCSCLTIVSLRFHHGCKSLEQATRDANKLLQTTCVKSKTNIIH